MAEQRPDLAALIAALSELDELGDEALSPAEKRAAMIERARRRATTAGRD